MNNFKKALESFNVSNYVDCIDFCLKEIKQNIKNIDAWSMCALSYEMIGNRIEGISYFQEALKIDSEFNLKKTYNLSINLAELYRRSGNTLKAIAILSKFMDNDGKEDSNLFFNLAKCYADLEDYEESIKYYTIAIKINPKDLGALFNLANQKVAIGNIYDALKYYSIAYDGGYIDAGINLAQIYVNLDKLQDAKEIYHNLEKKYENLDSNFYFNYANCLKFLHDFEISKNYYIKAIEMHSKPCYIVNLAHLFLSEDDLINGFNLYEHRRTLINLNVDIKNHFLDLLNTNDKNTILNFLKNKRILLYHEQGFGDSIMFARFIPFLLKYSNKCSILAPKPLLKLFQKFNLKVDENILNLNYEVAIPLSSLGFLFATNDNLKSSLDNFKNVFNFILKEEKKETKKINKDEEEIFKVGLNFSSNPRFQAFKEKSIYPFKLLSSLPKTTKNGAKIQYYSLQFEGLDSDLSKEFNVIDLSYKINDFLDIAKLMKNLNLIVSIDSALIHLALTMGIKSILLAHKRYDWRWGKLGKTKAHDCSWYNLLILGQKNLNDWSDVLENLKNEILDLR